MKGRAGHIAAPWGVLRSSGVCESRQRGQAGGGRQNCARKERALCSSAAWAGGRPDISVAMLWAMAETRPRSGWLLGAPAAQRGEGAAEAPSSAGELQRARLHSGCAGAGAWTDRLQLMRRKGCSSAGEQPCRTAVSGMAAGMGVVAAPPSAVSLLWLLRHTSGCCSGASRGRLVRAGAVWKVAKPGPAGTAGCQAGAAAAAAGCERRTDRQPGAGVGWAAGTAGSCGLVEGRAVHRGGGGSGHW